MPSAATARFILASASPRRSELLKTLFDSFEVIPSSVAETLEASLSPQDNAIAIARKKALAISGKHPEAWVLGADTIVVLDGELLGKPADESDAKNMLMRLSGRTHEVITAICLAKGETTWEEATCSAVTFHPITEDSVQAYIATGEPMDKAGAYAIQGRGGELVATFKGSRSNIVGLPIETLKILLHNAGVNSGNF